MPAPTVPNPVNLTGAQSYATAVMTEAQALVGAEATARASADTSLQTQVTALSGSTSSSSSSLQAQIDLKAPLASPNLSGLPTGPTAAVGTNTTQLATMAAVKAAADLKANLNSAALTGAPTTTDPGSGDNSTRIPNTIYCMRQEAFLQGQIDTINARLAAANIP